MVRLGTRARSLDGCNHLEQGSCNAESRVPGDFKFHFRFHINRTPEYQKKSNVILESCDAQLIGNV